MGQFIRSKTDENLYYVCPVYLNEWRNTFFVQMVNMDFGFIINVHVGRIKK